MTAGEILAGIREVLGQRLGVRGEVTEGTDVLGDLQLDSLQRMQLVVELENRFRICFEPEDEGEIATIGDVICLVQRRLGEGGGGA